jgi:hypothetical protein
MRRFVRELSRSKQPTLVSALRSFQFQFALFEMFLTTWLHDTCDYPLSFYKLVGDVSERRGLRSVEASAKFCPQVENREVG